MKRIASPSRSTYTEGIQCFDNGAEQPWEVFSFKNDYRIFIDGSAIHIGWSEVATAGGAAVQLLPDGRELIAFAHVPDEYPKSAVAAEFFALCSLHRHACLKGALSPEARPYYCQ